MIKSVVGIDISKDDFQVCLKVLDKTNRAKIKGTRSFKNNKKGFSNFKEWVNKRTKDLEPSFVMEATGIYHENLANYLYESGYFISVVLANKIKNYIKSYNIKTKTDKSDAKIIADFGLERELVAWEPMSPEYKNLRDLARELLALKNSKQASGSQLHAYKHSFEKLERVIELKEEQIAFYEEAINEIRGLFQDLVAKDPALEEKIKKLETIPGLGFETIVILVCETNGFKLFNSIKQLVSYAGLDVSFNQSGKYNGQTRISKKGNVRIRQALYMPALSAIQHNHSIKKLYERICEKNPKVKKKGIVAGMRKLLILSYTLWTKDETYNPDYKWSPSK